MVNIIAALIYYWIDLKKLWLDRFDKVAVLAVVVVVHPLNLGLIKEGFSLLGENSLRLEMQHIVMLSYIRQGGLSRTTHKDNKTKL